MAEQCFYAYLAGMIDGEGSIHMKKTRKRKDNTWYHVLRVSIANTNLKVLKDILRIIGFGCIYKTNKKGNKKHVVNVNYDCYQLDWSSKQAEKILLKTLSFLRIKHPQAVSGLLSRVLPRKEKEEMAAVIHDLNYGGF